MALSIFNRIGSFLLAFILLALSAIVASAQTTEFTYQGRLTLGGSPADGLFDVRFKLFDTPDVDTGAQQGPTLTQPTVQVMKGVFTVQLDFGGAVFDGSARYLEISIRPSGNTDPHIILGPRQPITASPYSVRSATAGNALQLAGVNANQYVLTSDSRMSDARDPLPNSTNYVQNTTSQQALSNFNISGNGTAGGTLSGNIVNAQTQYNINGNRVIGVSTFNTYVGLFAGVANTTGTGNSFFGRDAGEANTTGGGNSFFGFLAGTDNTTGLSNSFFGYFAGVFNTTGSRNSIFGFQAGGNNTSGNDNSFFGYQAGAANQLGESNSFFGAFAGKLNSTGLNNSFFGASAGEDNTVGSNNAFFGFNAGLENTTGGFNSFFGATAGRDNTTGLNNAFFGRSAGISNTTGSDNAIFGRSAGSSNTVGEQNSFFGRDAGFPNTTGSQNTFLGYQAGFANRTGTHNTIIGANANLGADDLSFATAIGSGATVNSSNTVVLGRGSDDVRVPGNLVVVTLGAAGGTDICRNGSNQLSTCSSSLRYKTDVQSFNGGLNTVRRLRPITFNWREGGQRDVGFAAEEVERVEPLLVTRNAQGEIEGVKYKQITTVLVNAVRQQQQTIEQQQRQIGEQQRQIDALKRLVCLAHPQADVCK